MTLGFSPCPNDTFIFDALIHGKIDTEGLLFEPVIEDVENLNRKAFKKELDITKLSFHTFAHLVNDYSLLRSGSALGKNCGPLLVGLPSLLWKGSHTEVIAIPGKYTTANFLMSLFFPRAVNKMEMLFSDIEDAVLKGKADVGLIIHENRFTYEQKGLKKILDLGEMWETHTGLPIPLGGIAMKRNLPDAMKQKINRVMKRSVEFALENPLSGMDFIKHHSQAMQENVIFQHIQLYVNSFTVDLGWEGEKAISLLFTKAIEAGVIPPIQKNLF